MQKSTPETRSGQAGASSNGRVSADQRFTGNRRCPICGGSDDDPRGQDVRCFGFLSTDGKFAHCTRVPSPIKNGAGDTFPHALAGRCPCGVEHGPAEPARDRRTKSKGSGRIVARYAYRDEQGNLLFEVCRFDPKSFRQRRPASGEGWVWSLGDVRRVLYRLPELIANPSATVFIAEGEKAAEALRGAGLVATCSPGGAGKWRLCDSSPLAGRNVVILPDHDQPGRDHAEAVARSLHGVAKSVKVLNLPGLTEKGDPFDWLAAGGSADQLVELASVAPSWEPAVENVQAGGSDGKEIDDDGRAECLPIGPAALSLADLGVTRASSLRGRIRNIEWVWKYRLAKGELALVAGDAGTGKSMLIQSIVATITTGGAWPCGEGVAVVGSALIVSAEDDPETSTIPRLIAMGADLDRVHFDRAALVVPSRDGKPPAVHPMSLGREWHAYWRRKLELTGAAVLVVDPLPSYLGRGVNDAKNIEIRAVLEPFIQEVIRPLGVCMIGNTHLNKATNAKTPLQRITGSVAYGALPRNTHLVTRDPDNPARRVFTQAKCNDSPADLASIAYSIEGATVESETGEPIETACPVFEAESLASFDLGTAVNGGSAEPSRAGRPGLRQAAFAEWLHDHLSGRVGWSALGAIADAAGAAGFLGTQREDKGKLRWSGFTALYRAKDALPNLPESRAGKRIDEERFDGRVHWKLLNADSAF